MPLGEVIMRTGWPRRSESVLVGSEPPCSSTTRCPAATHCAISRTMRSVATPALPPILTTSVIVWLLFFLVLCQQSLQEHALSTTLDGGRGKSDPAFHPNHTYN